MNSVWAIAVPMLLVGMQEPSWTKFTSKPGSFSIQLPATPTESKQRVPTATGHLDVFLFLAEKNDITYLVSYCDMPENEIKKGEEDKRLDFAQEGSIQSARGKLRTSMKLELDNFPGRDLVIDGENATVLRVRLILVDRRLYQIMAIGPSSVARSREVSNFLDSFQRIK